jgi:hypothetical protein
MKTFTSLYSFSLFFVLSVFSFSQLSALFIRKNVSKDIVQSDKNSAVQLPYFQKPNGRVFYTIFM